jgi:hypothetical protein
MSDEEARAFSFVVGLRDAYLSYHADKEREAYVTAVHARQACTQ